MGKLLPWFSANARDLPWRRTLDPYAIWVSEIMLQQTQVSTVIPYWERWMRELPDILSLARAPEQKVLKLWEGLGYYTRARNLHRAAKLLNGDPFPRQYADVLKLPGIGRYTAGAICSIAFNQPTPVLDGNVRRVLSRLFATGEDLWDIAQELVSAALECGGSTPLSISNASRHAYDSPALKSKAVSSHRTPKPSLRVPIKVSGPCGALNQALMELGAVICTPRQPRCSECPVANLCRARKQCCVDDFPAKPARAAVTHRRFAVYVYHHKGRYLVQQRPKKVVNARLWEFPNIELTGGNTLPPQGQLLSRFQHTITRYRIGVEAFLVQGTPKSADAGTPRPASKWLPLAGLDRLPFSSAHRKILVALRTENAV